MEIRRVSEQELAAFGKHLQEKEFAQGSIEKYLRDVRSFVVWLAGRNVDRDVVLEWKNMLLLKKYAPVTINSKLVSVNQFLRFLGWEECRVKELRIQRRLFRSSEKELTKNQGIEYLIQGLRKNGRDMDSVWQELYTWYKKSPEWQEKVEILLQTAGPLLQAIASM